MSDAVASAVGLALGHDPTGEGQGGSRSSATTPIRVLVVDDHALFRRGVEMVLGSTSDIVVVGEAARR